MLEIAGENGLIGLLTTHLDNLEKYVKKWGIDNEEAAWFYW